jgi:Zn-dependent peptidase ImmA (M78 family)
MMDDAYAKGLSSAEIEARALAWRDALGVAAEWAPDMVDILERRLPNIFSEFVLAVSEDRIMGDAEAYTQFEPPRIVLRESVYKAANNHEPRSQMTMAHELGHLVLHRGLAKARDASAPHRKELKPFNSAEWQARKFGAFFLLPSDVVRQFGSATDLAEGCRVSHQAASIRMQEVGHIGPRELPEVVADFLHQ